MLLVKLLQWVEDSRSGLSVFVSQVKEVDDFAEGCVLDDDHVLGEDFQEGKEASLCVEPGVCIELNKKILTFFWIGSRDLTIRPTPKS